MAFSGRCGRGVAPSLAAGDEGFSLRFEVGRDSDIGGGSRRKDGHGRGGSPNGENMAGDKECKQGLAGGRRKLGEDFLMYVRWRAKTHEKIAYPTPGLCKQQAYGNAFRHQAQNNIPTIERGDLS